MSRRAEDTIFSWGSLLSWRGRAKPKHEVDELMEAALAHAGELQGFARRLCATRSEADDLLQETFAKALARRTQLRDHAAIRAWLFRIMRNLNLDRRRSAAHRLQVLDEEVAERPDATRPRGTLRLTLERALAKIPADQRECVLLATVWGFRYREIAAIVDCPVGTVRSRVARGRATLAELLAEVAP